MNHLSASPTVSMQINARNGRLDAALAGRVVEAVVGALAPPEPRGSRPPTAVAPQSSAPPAETAA